MKIGRPERFGETSQHERDTLAEIVFLREIKRLSYQKVADQLNAIACWPRRGQKWTWGLIRHHYLFNRETTGGNHERSLK